MVPKEWSFPHEAVPHHVFPVGGVAIFISQPNIFFAKPFSFASFSASFLARSFRWGRGQR